MRNKTTTAVVVVEKKNFLSFSLTYRIVDLIFFSYSSLLVNVHVTLFIILFIEHRIVNHESTIIVPTQIDLTLPVQSMATSTTTQALLPPAATTNSTLFTYRSTAAGGNPVRQRAIAESTTSNLLISAEKFKTNVSTTNLRQARQTLTNSTALPSTLLPSTQRNLKSRIQQEKIVNTKGKRIRSLVKLIV